MMQDIITICIIAVISSVLTITLKKDRPEFSVIIAITAGVLIIFMILPAAEGAVRLFVNISEIAGIGNEYISVIIKSCVIAMVSGVCSSTCRDAGNSSLALKLEIAGRITIIMLAMPVINTLLNVILSVIK